MFREIRVNIFKFGKKIEKYKKTNQMKTLQLKKTTVTDIRKSINSFIIILDTSEERTQEKVRKKFSTSNSERQEDVK